MSKIREIVFPCHWNKIWFAKSSLKSTILNFFLLHFLHWKFMEMKFQGNCFRLQELKVSMLVFLKFILFYEVVYSISLVCVCLLYNKT